MRETMSAVEEILSEIPIDQLASQVGVDTDTAEQASRQVLPALLGGIQANTDDPGGAASFAQAVQQHDGGLVEGGVDLDQVNTHDGDKIVSHVFGPNRDQVEGKLGALGGVGGQDLIAKLLPILAPIVMAWLSKKLSGATAGQGGDLGSVFGGGSGAGAAGGSSGGGGLGDLLGPILGSVLGGGGAASGAGRGNDPLGDLLGGLLGGGRR
jgi:hypothetical protein